MTRFEYKVVPAPTRGQKAKGAKTAESRFALAIEAELNALAAEGWEYHRAETLPSVERAGLTSSQTTFRSLLIFRRALPDNLPAHLLDQQAAPQVQSSMNADAGTDTAAIAETETEALRDRVAQLMDQPDAAERSANRTD